MVAKKEPKPVAQALQTQPEAGGMSRAQALALFGLPDGATRDEVTRRYDILIRKMKTDPQGTDEDTRKQIEQAYSLLAGITWSDPVAEKRLRERDARPGLLARWLKIDQTRLDNLLHYYTKPVLAGLVGLGLLVWVLVTTVFRPPNDFVMLFAGSIYIEDQGSLEQLAVAELPDTTNPMISVVYFDDQTDGQMMSVISQKLMVEIGYGENDILVVDRSVYEQYAKQGAFRNLDGLLEQYGTTAGEQQAQRIAITPDSLVEGDDGAPHVYGISVTDSAFLQEAGILGTDLIATFGLKSEFPEKGELMMRLITGR